MHSDYLFKDKSHPFHHDSEERIEIFACSHHFVQPIVHFLRIKFLMEISNSPSKAHLPPKKGISGNKNLSNMQGYIYIRKYTAGCITSGYIKLVTLSVLCTTDFTIFIISQD